jgi:hypothetical protein
MDMGKSEVDAGTLARLMDGELSPDRRAEVMAILAANPELLNDLADAAVALELAGDQAIQKSGTLRRPRWWRPRLWLAAAAGLVAILFGVRQLDTGSNERFLFALHTLAPMSGSGGLQAVWGQNWEIPSLSVTRGGADVGDADFLVGVHSFRWALAVESQDPLAAAAEAERLLPMLRELPGGGPLAALVRQATEQVGAGERADPSASRLLHELGSDDSATGAGWLVEQLRLANLGDPTAVANNSREITDAIGHILERPDTSPELASVLLDVREALQTQSALALALERAYTDFAR